MNLHAIAAPPNRGILLDAVVFVLGLVLMRRLARAFMQLAAAASAGDDAAKLSLTVFFVGIFVLPAAGAVLKRWHFHQHRRRGNDGAEPLSSGAPGCLLHPAIYLAVSLTIGTVAGVMIGQRIFGEDFGQRAGIFLPMMLAVLVLGIVQTFLVYRYLSPPRKPPGAFLRDPRTAAAGDLCIFVNMILFQVLWTVMLSSLGRVTDAPGLAGRVFLAWFLTILLYLPPRIFYLADDAGRPASRLSILLATSPIVLHTLFG
ncbi:MAG TPA: hypothetical protein VEX86_23715 [Longimicrobium sp.]|nr:hypothetical protein [Longimicrobium sp.]